MVHCKASSSRSTERSISWFESQWGISLLVLVSFDLGILHVHANSAEHVHGAESIEKVRVRYDMCCRLMGLGEVVR